MAITRTDQVYSGVLPNADTVIATIGANTTFIMRGFWISNSNGLDYRATLKIDNKNLLVYSKPIPAGDTLLNNDINVPITTGKTIRVQGEVAAGMDYYIWGINEVTA